MSPIKIGIVEDDLLIADGINEMLEECGYTVLEPAVRYGEAIAMIEQESPDLMLIDINILGSMDGIEVGRTVRQAFGIPFIFLTANTDFGTIDRARYVVPAAFLAKPVTKAQLYAAIEMAMANQSIAIPKTAGDALQPKAPLFVKDGYNFRKVTEEEILFAESEQNYIQLYLTGGQKVCVRGSISDFSSRLSPQRFLRIHRSFIIAIDKIVHIAGNTLTVAGRELPVSRSNREELMRVLGLKG